MKPYGESGGITPRILNLGTGWMWLVSFKPWTLHPWGKSHRYPLNRGLGGFQSHFRRGDKAKINPCFCLVWNPCRQSIAQLLYWLSYLPNYPSLWYTAVLWTYTTPSHVYQNLDFSGRQKAIISWQHGMACPRVSDGRDGLHIRRVAANILNTKLRRADKGWSSSFWVERGANSSSP
jgi:hypothetical protein